MGVERRTLRGEPSTTLRSEPIQLQRMLYTGKQVSFR